LSTSSDGVRGPQSAARTGPDARRASRPHQQQLSVTVQIATSRRGVPHARSLATWANAAFHSPRSARRGSGGAEISIRIIGAAESRRLNRTWRGRDNPTNVLSFPSEPLPCPASQRAERKREGRAAGRWALTRKGDSDLASAQDPAPGSPLILGDLAICAPVVAREAREQGKSAQAHWAHMVIHGVLHLLGYDHENDRDADQMESREVKILRQLGYPDPYV
jgi:probable rRNA maturation factor